MQFVLGEVLAFLFQVKCKPAVNCFKLREFQRDNSSHMSTNEQSMFYTAMAELEQIQPRSESDRAYFLRSTTSLCTILRYPFLID